MHTCVEASPVSAAKYKQGSCVRSSAGLKVVLEVDTSESRRVRGEELAELGPLELAELELETEAGTEDGGTTQLLQMPRL
jgi:hypothetical protein